MEKIKVEKLAWIIFASCCVFFSFQPIKYILADGPIGLLRSKPIDSYFYLVSFYTHISLGGVALLVGWTQFSKKLRKRYLKLHSVIGKIYITSIFISGPFAFYLGFFVYGGLVTQIGFTFGAAVWIFATYMGYSAIRKGDVTRHKEYMMYSYAGTCAAIVLRLILPPLMMITSFKVAYGIAVWMSWIPSILLVYLFLHKKETLLFFYKRFYIKQAALTIALLGVVTFLLSFTRMQTWLYKAASFEGLALEKVQSLATSSFTEEKLVEIENYLKKESETTSMLVLEHGKIIFEYGDVSEISYVAAVRKSILSLLYGKYVENSSIDLQETIGDIGIDDQNGLSDLEKTATIGHLITSRSGILHPSVDGTNNVSSIQAEDHKTPGNHFVSNDWDYNVAAFILEQKSGKTIYEEIEQQLAIPLGFEDWNIANQTQTVDKEISQYPAHHLHLSTRDLAKVGQLMLQGGKWEGKQIVASEWIQKITTVVTPKTILNQIYEFDASSPLQRSYGYSWWLFERFYDNPDFEGAYTALGNFGHFITVIPKRDVVIVHKTTRDLLTYAGFSDRASTPAWRYWWILRNLMLNRKNIAELETTKSADEILAFIKAEDHKNSAYAISERLINEYGQSLADQGKHEDAIKFFELNLELYPNHGYYTHRIFNYYGNSLMLLDRKEDALRAFKRSLELNPDNNPIAKKKIAALDFILE